MCQDSLLIEFDVYRSIYIKIESHSFITPYTAMGTKTCILSSATLRIWSL